MAVKVHHSGGASCCALRLAEGRSAAEGDGAAWAEILFRMPEPSGDTTASRFRPVSIAGLVVAAYGVFVFAVALRHWLNRHRALHVETAEGDT